ncbi:hypothetical protein J1TS1_28570 [Shouchella clausii]|uniref:hypothetical protein n=1 Tax=Shouchella clausii TaxID=79880 RepID=UPI000BA6D454|nr:hypothetical protein [Shouchella clausii]PAF08703.1 hypothetical protein CHH65_14035 [Shouchella clausii]GIN08712.1 hypothetical protein J1TS1_28570 [Shouchella clausii]GIN13156.1 hypothetical protein J26TS2_30230 [Shouchella clausii]
MDEIYEIPESLFELFREVEECGFAQYRIINTNEGMSMDNTESMAHFLECVGVPAESIAENHGTQVILSHPDFEKQIVIDSGGLGDFFSHCFDCSWHEE